MAGIGVTGQMHTLIVLGEDGKAVRPAMMWNDTRTKIILPELKNKIRKFPEGEYLSKTISTGSPAANLYWMKKYEPGEFGKNKKVFDRTGLFSILPYRKYSNRLL